MPGPQRPQPSRSLAELRPDLAEQWPPALNGYLTPDKVTARSGLRVWWKSDVGPDLPGSMAPRVAAAVHAGSVSIMSWYPRRHAPSVAARSAASSK